MQPIFAAIPYPHLDPVALRIGPVAIRWYGLAYLFGFVAAYRALGSMIRHGLLRVPPDVLADLVSWLAAGVMIGGRAGWWLVYHRPQGAPEPWYEPIAIWHGGMSFHGGLVGVLVALAVWSRARHVPLWNLADAAALVVPIGLFFGRIANFINAELVGRPTRIAWGVIFPGDTLPRHPSQLYEALLEGPLLLLILWTVRNRLRPSKGRIAALFLVLYGAFRFAIEFTREPDAQLGFIAFGWLTMGQLLSAALVAAGLVLWALLRPHRLRSDCTNSANTIQTDDGLGLAFMLAVAGCKPANSGDSSGSMKMNGDSSTSSASTMPAATTCTCTMHPEVTSDKPVKCPKCGMDLVARK